METRSQHLASENQRLVGSSFVGGTQVKSSYLDKLEAKSILESTFDKDIEDARAAAKNRIKQKFRERRSGTISAVSDETARGQKITNKESGNKQLNGEEIYQHLDFYSRSLKSVSTNK